MPPEGEHQPPNGEEARCLEDNFEDIRRLAEKQTNEGPPLCFQIATIFEWGMGARGEPICMYRCSWDEECNWYMNIDEEEFKEVELENCA